MNVTQYYSSKEFLEKVKNFLMEDEVVNNLPLGILNALANSEEAKEKNLFALVENNHSIILIIICTGQNLVVCGVNPDLNEAIEEGINYLVEKEIQIPGVIGLKSIATKFAEKWCEITGSSMKIDMKQRIYRLDEVYDVNYSPGRLRLATFEDVDLIQGWTYRFAEEAMDGITHEQALKLAESGIKSKTIYIWEDGGKIVSIAKKTRPTKNGIVVNLVYTPKEYRGRGYATSCVATLSQKLLNDGYKFCSLYTDLSNPTSNDIYMKIGYKPIVDSIVYSFNKK